MLLKPMTLEEQIEKSRKIAAKFARRNPTRSDDIYSAALEGLVVGLDAAKTKNVPDAELEFFLYSRITTTIQEFVSSDVLVRVPRRSRARHDIPYTVTHSIGMMPEDELYTQDPEAGFTVDDLPLEEDESTVVKMLVEGHSKLQIGKELGIPRRAVYSLVAKIRSKTGRWCNAMQISH